VTLLVLTLVAAAVFACGVATGMAIKHVPMEEEFDLWPDVRDGTYEADHPAFRIVERPPFDWARDGNEGA
jgi:hypothetical protein